MNKLITIQRYRKQQHFPKRVDTYFGTMATSVFFVRRPVLDKIARAHHYPVSMVHTSTSVRNVFERWIESTRDKRKKAYQTTKEEWMQREKDIWSNYSQDLAKYSQRKRETMRQVQEMAEIEDRLKREEQEEAVRQELLKRMENSPKDKLDEDYFKDWKRFDKYQDNRDPLFKGVKDTGTDDWRGLMREKLLEAKDNYQLMKESQPLTYTGAVTDGPRGFGYKTVSVGKAFLYSLLILILLLGVNEAHYTYHENRREKEAYIRKT